jgi:hypothetical protein
VIIAGSIGMAVFVCAATGLLERLGDKITGGKITPGELSNLAESGSGTQATTGRSGRPMMPDLTCRGALKLATVVGLDAMGFPIARAADDPRAIQGRVGSHLVLRPSSIHRPHQLRVQTVSKLNGQGVEAVAAAGSASETSRAVPTPGWIETPTTPSLLSRIVVPFPHISR